MLYTNKKHAPNEQLHSSSPDGATEYRQVVERSDARRRRRRFRSVAEKEPLLRCNKYIKCRRYDRNSVTPSGFDLLTQLTGVSCSAMLRTPPLPVFSTPLRGFVATTFGITCVISYAASLHHLINVSPHKKPEASLPRAYCFVDCILFIPLGIYPRYATFSSRFIMANMKRAESRQSTMNTPQTTHKGRSPQR